MKTRILNFLILFVLMNASRVFSQALYIPDSIEFCGEKIPLEFGDVRERLETQLMVLANQRVQVTLWFQRKDRYFPGIEKVLETRKLPSDLKYVPVIESSLIIRARSRSNALGIWQFMEPTGKENGLHVADDIDERMHTEKSTQAALDYLSELRSEFGTWSLALAAYNVGPGRIREEIYNQGTSDYYSMVLPDETERYVFNAIAAKLIFENPEKYGYALAEIVPFKSPEFREIDVKLVNFVPVKILAFCAGTTYREFRSLNPWLIGVNLPKGSHKLKIPTTQATEFSKKLDGYFARLQGYQNFKTEKRVTVDEDQGTMRIGPGVEYPAFRYLALGSRLKVSGRTDRLDRGHYWYIFKQKNGASGWIWGGEIND